MYHGLRKEKKGERKAVKEERRERRRDMTKNGWEGEGGNMASEFSFRFTVTG